MALVYCTTNLVNGKKYIGSTNGKYENYFGGGVYIRKAIKKYGKENFVKDILWSGEDRYRWDMENYWLEYFNCADNKLFYNVSEQAGGDPSVNVGRKLSKSHRKAISNGIKGREVKHSTRVLKSKYLVKTDETDWMTTGELSEFYGYKNRSAVTNTIRYIKSGTTKNPSKNGNTKFLLDMNFKYKTI